MGGTGAIVFNVFYMSTGRCLICKNALNFRVFFGFF
jgi:hypothetical protein